MYKYTIHTRSKRMSFLYFYELRIIFMVTTWTVKCALCGKRGSVSSTTDDGLEPRHNSAMTSKCPRNPSGGNFGHSPV